MTGIVDYAHYDDMKYAVFSCPALHIKNLDDTEVWSTFSWAYIRVREYDSRWSYSTSRSRESRRSYSRSPVRSPYMSRSPSHSHSYSGRSRRSQSRSRPPVTSVSQGF